MDDLVTWLRAQWDRAAAVALLALGGILVIAGYVGVSGTDSNSDQLSYLASGGIGGLFCLGLGAALLISANLGDEWRKLDELTRAVRQSSAAPSLEIDARLPADATDDPPSADLRPAGRVTA